MPACSKLLAAILPIVAIAVSAKNSNKPPAFFLAGDSTTAIDGGWGDGFLGTLKSPAWGINTGQSGATTLSYQQGGNWTNVTAHVEEYAKEFDTYVTISFGHNDQKTTSNVTFDEYQANLIKFAEEIKSLGGTPLLVSSLSRRVFTSEHNATDSLHDQRLAAIYAANVTSSPIIDLNGASLNYVNTIGEDAAHQYNLSPSDNTHLNEWGGVVFGRMVSDLIIDVLPCLTKWTVPNETLSDEVWNGIAA